MPLQGHHTSLEGGCISSANPVRNYKRSWALVNDASSPSQADFASTHMNLPFFVNYIWFIILRVNYNYVGKLQLVIIDCGQVWSIVWIAIDCLNCDRLPELWSIAWIAIDCLNCDRLPELWSIAWIAIDYMNCDRLYELWSIVQVVIYCMSCNTVQPFCELEAIVLNFVACISWHAIAITYHHSLDYKRLAHFYNPYSFAIDH